jgi:hypothetical protein
MARKMHGIGALMAKAAAGKLAKKKSIATKK